MYQIQMFSGVNPNALGFGSMRTSVYDVRKTEVSKQSDSSPQAWVVQRYEEQINGIL